MTIHKSLTEVEMNMFEKDAIDNLVAEFKHDLETLCFQARTGPLKIKERANQFNLRVNYTLWTEDFNR